MNDIWPTRKLRDIADIRVSNVDKKSHTAETPVRLCNYMDVYANDYITNETDFMQASASPAEIERFSLQRGDVIITKDSETPDDIGVPAVVSDEIENLVCGYHLCLIRPNNSDLHSVYLAKQLATSKFAGYFALHASGSTRFGLPVGAIENIDLPFPPKPEQTKIAEILSTVDQAIDQTEALIAKQQRIKTGLMHDLLTRGIDENGDLRPSYDKAPELYQESELGWIPKEWRLTSVGSVLSRIDAGKSPECPDKPTPTGEWGVLKVSAVQPSGFRSSENKIIEKSRFVNPSYEVKDGDLLISRSNTYDLVGVVCLVRNPQTKLLLSDKTLRLRCNPDRIITPFLFQILQQHFVRRQIEINATGTSGSMKNISQPGIRRLKIFLPPKQEQDRLSECLYSIEDRVVSEQEHLAKLSRLKTALMQDLLTGKVSVVPLLAEEECGGGEAGFPLSRE